jgi:hypothetical protein
VSRKLCIVILLTASLLLAVGLIGCSKQPAASDSASEGNTAQGSDYGRRGGGPGGPAPGANTGRGPGPGGAMNQSFATVLGITPDQLQAELKAGKQLSDIVSEHGMDMEQFNQKVLDSEKARLAQEVKDGKITQEQSDQSLQALQRRLANPDGFRGNQQQQPPQQQQSQN